MALSSPVSFSSPFHAFATWFSSSDSEAASQVDYTEILQKKIDDPNEGPINQLYYRELKDQIIANKCVSDPSALFEAFGNTANRYEELTRRVEEAAQKLSCLKDADALHACLKDADALHAEAIDQISHLSLSPITETERAIYLGRISRVFRNLDNQFASIQGKPLHRYCGCHVREEGLDYKKDFPQFTISYPKSLQTNSYLEGRSALLHSWSLGGGHNSVQGAIAERIAEAGMHSYHVQADLEILHSFDQLRNLTSGRYSDADIIRYFLRNNYWRTLRFINWAFSGKPCPEKIQRINDAFMRAMLARGLPDIQMTMYARNAGSAANAAYQLGIPDINFESDLQVDLFDIEKPGDVRNPYFADAVMLKGDKILKSAYERLPEDQIHETGFPVRNAFLQEWNIKDLKSKYGIADDVRVLVFATGSEGIENDYAEQIVDSYEEIGESLSKVHLFVLCGHNEAKKKQLEIKFSRIESPKIKVEIKEWIEEEDLAKLYAMAADSSYRGILLSLKGGGGTVSQGMASGAPMLFCGTGDAINWEKGNIDDACERNVGKRIDKNGKELVGQLEDLYMSPYEKIEIDSKERSMRLIQSLIEKAESDREFMGFREQAAHHTLPSPKDLFPKEIL